MSSFVFGPITPPRLIHAFCDYIWNGRDISAAEHLLADNFIFRSHVTTRFVGRPKFAEYVRHTAAAGDRRYEVVDCLCAANRAFARVRVSSAALGDAGSQDTVERLGRRLFRCELESADVEWMLGDLGGADPYFHFARNRISDVWVCRSWRRDHRPPDGRFGARSRCLTSLVRCGLTVDICLHSLFMIGTDTQALDRELTIGQM